jgi:hypothetical protein
MSSSDEDSSDSSSESENNYNNGKGLAVKVKKQSPANRKGLFKDAGVLPTRADQCKNCKEPYADNYRCNNQTKHLKCANCNLLFPERA